MQRIGAFTIAVAAFLLVTAGKAAWALCGVDVYDLCVGLAFIVIFVYLYSRTRGAFKRLIVSVMLGYVLTSTFKELVLDPTRLYPVEYASLLPVTYTILRHRRKPKDPATQKHT